MTQHNNIRIVRLVRFVHPPARLHVQIDDDRQFRRSTLEDRVFRSPVAISDRERPGAGIEVDITQYGGNGLHQRKVGDGFSIFQRKFFPAEDLGRHASADGWRNSGDKNQGRSQILDLTRDIRVETADNRRHPDHGGYSNHNPKHGQEGSKLIFPQ